MGKHKIAILSDTHSLLRDEVKGILAQCDLIFHAGDIADEKTYQEIGAYAKSYFVRGNADKEWAKDLPTDLKIEVLGFTFYMIHNKKHMSQAREDIDFVIYGHSHKYECREENGIQVLNPGSCGPRRFHQPVTMILLTLDDRMHSFEIEKLDFSPVLNENISLPKKDLDRLIADIVKDMKKGRSVAQIAKKNRVEEEFVKQILQIYTTHPGIDVDGIMNRMDIWGM